MSIRKRLARRGFSLVETLVFIIVVSIAVVGVVRVLALTSSASVDPQLRKQALAIAESMLEEIEMARFTYCDPTDDAADTAASGADCALPEVAGQEAGGNGRPYDNVNDYVGAYGAPKAYTTDAAGNAFPAGYTAQVTITSEAGLGPAGARIGQADGSAASINVLHINVTVNYQNGAASVALDGYRTRYAPNLLP